MKIIKEAVAGTLESSDLQVKVAQGAPNRLDIHIRSEVIRQFGGHIRAVIDDTLAKLGVTEGDITVEDKGALDCAVRARVQTAVLRASDSNGIDWEKMV